ncbi:major capsid protein [Carnimonas bestiolae]|uniref:major capsid protein n=1 Tax=Carnimonas bestiolae TaxID=3402172 RepID=UPI003EDB8542
MSIIFDKKAVTTNSNSKKQWDVVSQHRQYHGYIESNFAANDFAFNATNILPTPFYAQIDSQTKQIMQDPTADVLLQDLMPLARALDIGVLVHQYKVAKDADQAVTTSLSGLEPIPHVGSGYDYNGAIIPVHQSGFYQEWRERAGKQGTDWDDWVDLQAGATRSVRTRMVDYLFDGAPELQFKGVPSYGLRNGASVVKGQIGVDLTSSNTDGAAIRDEVMRLVRIIRVDNRVAQDLTLYVSPEINANLDRFYATDGALAGRSIREIVLGLTGVSTIKETSKLSGNEIIAGVLSQEYILPLVGQAVSTVFLPRTTPFSRHEAVVWSAMGIEVRADGNGRSGWAYFSR